MSQCFQVTKRFTKAFLFYSATFLPFVSISSTYLDKCNLSLSEENYSIWEISNTSLHHLTVHGSEPIHNSCSIIGWINIGKNFLK